MGETAALQVFYEGQAAASPSFPGENKEGSYELPYKLRGVAGSEGTHMQSHCLGAEAVGLLQLKASLETGGVLGCQSACLAC